MRRLCLENREETMPSSVVDDLKGILGSIALIRIAQDPDLLRGLVICSQYNRISNILAEKVISHMVAAAPNSKLLQFWLSLQSSIKYPLDVQTVPVQMSYQIVGPELLSVAVALGKTTM